MCPASFTPPCLREPGADASAATGTDSNTSPRHDSRGTGFDQDRHLRPPPCRRPVRPKPVLPQPSAGAPMAVPLPAQRRAHLPAPAARHKRLAALHTRPRFGRRHPPRQVVGRHLLGVPFPPTPTSSRRGRAVSTETPGTADCIRLERLATVLTTLRLVIPLFSRELGGIFFAAQYCGVIGSGFGLRRIPTPPS